MDMGTGQRERGKGNSELWTDVTNSDVVARLAFKNLTASGRDEMSGKRTSGTSDYSHSALLI
jgi:hypothetical protein